MKHKSICLLTGLIIGAGSVIVLNSMERVIAFEVRQSAEVAIMGAIQ